MGIPFFLKTSRRTDKGFREQSVLLFSLRILEAHLARPFKRVLLI